MGLNQNVTDLQPRNPLRLTAGLFNTNSNPSTATFTLTGPALGLGLHPLFAQVETTAGLKKAQTLLKTTLTSALPALK